MLSSTRPPSSFALAIVWNRSTSGRALRSLPRSSGRADRPRDCPSAERETDADLDARLEALSLTIANHGAARESGRHCERRGNRLGRGEYWCFGRRGDVGRRDHAVFAEEIVAYVPASTEPARIARGTSAYLVGSDSEGCRGVGRVRNRGARVEEAPSQLAISSASPSTECRFTSAPPGCRLINGQAVVLRFRSELVVLIRILRLFAVAALALQIVGLQAFAAESAGVASTADSTVSEELLRTLRQEGQLSERATRGCWDRFVKNVSRRPKPKRMTTASGAFGGRTVCASSDETVFTS